MKGCFYLAATAVWLAALCVSGAYADAVAVVSGEVFLRAGPAPTYPALLPLPVGAKLITHGCNAAYSWCDVSWGAHRGWVSSPYIRFDAHGSKVAVTADYAVSVNVGIVDFDYGYWQAYYVGMPWFGLWGSYYLAPPPPGGPHGNGPGNPSSGGHGGPHGTSTSTPPAKNSGDPHGTSPEGFQRAGADCMKSSPAVDTNPANQVHMHNARMNGGMRAGGFLHGSFRLRR